MRTATDIPETITTADTLAEALIRRLRDPLHRSHIDQLEAALRVPGLQVEADVTVNRALTFAPSGTSAAA